MDNTLTITDAAPSLMKTAARALSSKKVQNMMNLLWVENDYRNHHGNHD